MAYFAHFSLTLSFFMINNHMTKYLQSINFVFDYTCWLNTEQDTLNFILMCLISKLDDFFCFFLSEFVWMPYKSIPNLRNKKQNKCFIKIRST